MNNNNGNGVVQSPMTTVSTNLPPQVLIDNENFYTSAPGGIMEEMAQPTAMIVSRKFTFFVGFSGTGSHYLSVIQLI